MLKNCRIPLAKNTIDDIRRQLLDAAAFGKHVTPEQLEHMARKLADTMQTLADESTECPIMLAR
ncbi:DUF6374 family protein [Nocardia sp. NPDC004604]|uniref:DUF6374 family protein n=1 Tax=Nocardia sp. NPDC004604 TaxID=3157013 RepID=UPI0033AF8984